MTKMAVMIMANFVKKKSEDGDNDLRQHRMEAEGSSYSQ